MLRTCGLNLIFEISGLAERYNPGFQAKLSPTEPCESQFQCTTTVPKVIHALAVMFGVDSDAQEANRYLVAG